MGVGARQGLPQGRFYYSQAEEEERRKSANDHVTHLHSLLALQIQFEISLRARGQHCHF